MKKKDYQKPAMKVAMLQHQAPLLQASVETSVSATMNGVWEEENI